jgi:GAF domain-containing protein/anti-sigma regulatory factor (Ser/Thr protein kinase)
VTGGSATTHDPRAEDDPVALIAHLTETINSNLDLGAVLQAITDAGTRLSGAAFGAFFYNAVDKKGDAYRLHVVSGARKEDFATLPAQEITALFEPTIAGGGPVRIADLTEEPRFEELPAGRLSLRSYLATPVVARTGEVIGALLFGHPEPAVFDETTETLVRAVAAHGAVAVENARLFAAEQAGRADAERLARGLTLLQRLNERLAPAMTVEETMRALVDVVAGPLQATYIGCYLEQRARMQSWVVSTDPGEGTPVVREGRVPTSFPSPILDALTSGEPVVMTARTELAGRYPEFAEAVTPVASGLVVPMMTTGETRGVLAVAWAEDRVFGPGPVRLWRAVADQLSPALERARLAEAAAAAQAELQRHVDEVTRASQTLQRSLLPRSMPAVEGVEVAVGYLPGMVGAEVGGDWYDLVLAPDGRVTLVVGDVEGHSISAAAVMGRVSTALNAYLREGHPAHVALQRLNPLVEEAGLTVTCCLVTLDVTTGSVEVVRAGHPHPIRWRGAAEEVDVEGGPPLGVVAFPSWPVAAVQLERGDRIVLYTDGLVDRPGEDPDVQGRRLLAAVDASGGDDLDRAVDHVLDAMRSSHDDVALLIAAYSPAPPAALLVIEDESHVADARRFTRTILGDWQLAGLTDTTTLVVSEMVTNALLHAGGPAVLELRRENDTVRVAVTDPHPRPPETQRADTDALNGRGLVLVEACSASWGVDPVDDGKTVWALVTG